MMVEEAPVGDINRLHPLNRATPYTKINSEWQTRILELHPGMFGQPIVANLHVIDLIQNSGAVLHIQQRRIRYQALSYCWGKPNPETDRVIKCNGITTSVMSNLQAGLQRIRKIDEIVYLWADAICINQTDLGERSGQVANMLNIFMKAEEVIAWLGEPDLDRGHLDITTGSELPDGKRFSRLRSRLSDNSWFTRVWVKQEVWAAERLVVKYGSETIPWSDVVDAGLAKDFVRPDKATRLTIKDDDKPRTNFRTYWKSGREAEDTTDILTLLLRYRGSQCSDIRDTIYGLVGMSTIAVREALTESDAKRNALVVDYNSSASDLFQSFAVYLLQRDRHLGILYLNAPFGSTSGSDLPSWVPDWTDLQLFTWSIAHTYGWDYKSGTTVYRGIFETRPLSVDHGLFHIDASVLQVKGWTVGKIQRIREMANPSSGAPMYHNIAKLSDVAACEPFQTQFISFLTWLKRDPDLAALEQRHPEKFIDKVPPPLCIPHYWNVPSLAREGDIVAFVYGGGLPLVLRPQHGPSVYRYIGPAVPHEVRNQEAMLESVHLSDGDSGMPDIDNVLRVWLSRHGALIHSRVMAAVFGYLETLSDPCLQTYDIV